MNNEIIKKQLLIIYNRMLLVEKNMWEDGNGFGNRTFLDELSTLKGEFTKYYELIMSDDGNLMETDLFQNILNDVVDAITQKGVAQISYELMVMIINDILLLIRTETITFRSEAYEIWKNQIIRQLFNR